MASASSTTGPSWQIERRKKGRLRTIAVVDVVVVEVAVAAVEDPRVVDVVPLGEPSVRAVVEHRRAASPALGISGQHSAVCLPSILIKFNFVLH